MKVLVVDDEEDVRRIARMSLTRVGQMDVVVAQDAEEGRRRAHSERPDVVLLDVMMPGTDGPALLFALRQDPATRDIPVVFLTAHSLPGEVGRLKALGAAGVIAKPFDPMELPAQLRALLAV